MSIGFLLFAGFVVILFAAIQKESGRLLSQKAELAQMNADADELDNFELRFEEYEKDWTRVGELFVDPITPIDFLEFLEKLSQTSQVSIEISPSNPMKAPGDYWPSLDFRVTVSGLYGNMAKVIEKIEYAPYLLEIKSLAIKPPATRDTKGGQVTPVQVDADMVVKVYTKELSENTNE